MTEEYLQTLLVASIDHKAEFTLTGEQATIALTLRDGRKQPLQIDRRALAMLVVHLTRAHLSMEYVASTRGAPVEAPAADAERVRAQTQLGENRPTLTVQSGLIQHFSISADQAEGLAADLRKAAEVARANDTGSRH